MLHVIAIAINALRIPCIKIEFRLFQLPKALAGLKIRIRTNSMTKIATGQINVFQVLDMICFTVITKPS